IDIDLAIFEYVKERIYKQYESEPKQADKIFNQSKFITRILDIAHEAKESFTLTTNETISLSDIHEDLEDEDLDKKYLETIIIKNEIERIKKCLIVTLDGYNKKFNHVLLVGGTSRMTFINKMFKDLIEKYPNNFDNNLNLSKTVSGDEAIAIGTTIMATKLSNCSESLSI